MALAFAKIAFTPSVRAEQKRLGSGRYDSFLSPERTGGDRLGPNERAFVEARDGFYQSTVSDTGWPYVQFRGGAPGFLRVLDDQTVAYADLRGNRQYLSLGNLKSNNRVSLILMDYANARRLKIWGHVRIVEPETPQWDALPSDWLPPKAERLMTIPVSAFDWNCPQHIPRRLTDGEVMDHIAALEADNKRLRMALDATQP